MKIKEIITNPRHIIFSMGMHGGFKFLSDESYLKLMYWSQFKRRLNLDHPLTFNEKIQWLKLHNTNPLLSTLVDKYEVKEYVSKMIGEEYIIPTIGVWDSFDDIDFSMLPSQFVLKCTHDSGGLVICKDKESLDLSAAKAKIDRAKRNNYFWLGRETPYKKVIPRIIAEPYLEDHRDKELRDYKFFTFNGVVRSLFVASDRTNPNEETKFDFFDRDYNHLPIINGHPNARIIPHKPNNFERMIELAETLGKGFPHVRVDFYEVDGKVYFGELTFSHFSGFIPFEPEEWDFKFGSWLEIE